MTATTATINVPFKATIQDDVRDISFLNRADLPGTMGVYATASKAKKILKQQAIKAVDEALEIARHDRDKAIVACNDGTVLLVGYSGSWGYSICYKGARGFGAYVGGGSLSGALTSAMRHASQTYGGINFVNLSGADNEAHRIVEEWEKEQEAESQDVTVSGEGEGSAQVDERSTPESRLREVWEMVEDKENWKRSVDAVVLACDATEKEITDAVVHFTGSVPTVRRCEVPTRHPDGLVEFMTPAFEVKAPGYYATIGI